MSNSKVILRTRSFNSVSFYRKKHLYLSVSLKKMCCTKYNEEAKEWSGYDRPPIFNPKISLGHVILKSCTIYESNIAQISDDNGIQLTFDEIRLKTIRAAQNLQKLGYEPKQVFGLMAKNSHNVAPIVFASISIGCPVNTLDPTFGKVELIHMLSITKPALMFCDVEAYDLVKECLTEMGNGAKIFTFGGSKDGSKPVEDLLSKTENEDDFVPLNIDGENEIAFIACSSGTTGLSKGVCLSHASLLSVMDRGTSINSSDVILCFSSLYWLSGIVFLFYGTLNGSTRIITTDAYAPELQLRFIEQYKVTVTMNAPHHLTLMLKSAAFAKTDLSSLKRQMTGGSRTPMIVKNEMNSCLPNGRVYVGYGLTEISGIAAIDDPLSKDKDTVGRLNVGIHVKIIDENGKRCGINVNGEICLKTNYKCLGYYENPKATNELFDSEGFILTGDVGHFDEHGYLYIVDRKKEFLKYCNSQISPSEIESFLIGSPHIKSVCVVGVPDDFAGDLPAAVVVKTEGSNITEKDVFDLVSEHYSDIYKLRGGVFFVDSLPATPSGKILRRKAKEIVLSLLSS